MRLVKLLFPLCVGCGPAHVDGSVAVTTPTLAYVAPGVEVVTDWDTPVFFADGFYWYLDGGIWYRSVTLGGERVVVHHVPVAVARIHQPERFAHYRAPHYVAQRPMPARAFHEGPRVGGMHGGGMHRR